MCSGVALQAVHAVNHLFFASIKFSRDSRVASNSRIHSAANIYIYIYIYIYKIRDDVFGDVVAQVIVVVCLTGACCPLFVHYVTN